MDIFKVISNRILSICMASYVLISSRWSSFLLENPSKRRLEKMTRKTRIRTLADIVWVGECAQEMNKLEKSFNQSIKYIIVEINSNLDFACIIIIVRHSIDCEGRVTSTLEIQICEILLCYAWQTRCCRLSFHPPSSCSIHSNRKYQEIISSFMNGKHKSSSHLVCLYEWKLWENSDGRSQEKKVMLLLDDVEFSVQIYYSTLLCRSQMENSPEF